MYSLCLEHCTKYKSLLTLLLFLLLSISHELPLAKLHWSLWATCSHCWCAAIHSPYCWSHWQTNGMERWNHSCPLHCQTIAPITIAIEEIYNQWLILVQGLYLCWLAMFWIHKKLSVICSYRRLTVCIMVFDTHTYPHTSHQCGATQACPNNLLNHLNVTRDNMRKKIITIASFPGPAQIFIACKWWKAGRDLGTKLQLQSIANHLTHSKLLKRCTSQLCLFTMGLWPMVNKPLNYLHLTV